MGQRRFLQHRSKESRYYVLLYIIISKGAAIIEARKLSSAASAANAACDHIYDWLVGTTAGDVVSMAVVSDGSYGIPEGLVFSFPVTCSHGDFQIVQGYKVAII